MLKVIIAAAAVVLSVEVVAISFAPGAEMMTGTIPVRALKGDRLNTQSIKPVQKTQQPAAPTTQVRQVRLA